MSQVSVSDRTRMRSVKKVLISQPPPQTGDSPYLKMAERYNIEIDFVPFIKIEPTAVKDFRKQKINIKDHTAIIFTSRNAVDHFFKLLKDVRCDISPEMKYFCVSEQTAHYLHKYIVVRRRRVFTGGRNAADLIDIIKKHKKEKYLFPCSDVRMDDIPNFLSCEGIYHNELVIYQTLPNDITALKDVEYDIIAFFSPSGVRSLLKNFPDFEQKTVRIAAFGPSTAQAVHEAKFILDIEAPDPNMPSMVGALERYIQQIKE